MKSTIRAAAEKYAVEELGWTEAVAYRADRQHGGRIVYIRGQCDDEPAKMKLLVSEVGVVLDEADVN